MVEDVDGLLMLRRQAAYRVPEIRTDQRQRAKAPLADPLNDAEEIAGTDFDDVHFGLWHCA